jgi:hypothetical protein
MTAEPIPRARTAANTAATPSATERASRCCPKRLGVDALELGHRVAREQQARIDPMPWPQPSWKAAREIAVGELARDSVQQLEPDLVAVDQHAVEVEEQRAASERGTAMGVAPREDE